MRKILTSTVMVFALAVTLVGATNAFFSDVETSTGNTLASGSIDLKIDNTSYYNGVRSDFTSWELKDIDTELFFNFTDIKPGDWGEDTISLHVDNNEAWACVDLDITQDDEGTLTEPEQDVNDTGDNGGTDLFDGELASQVNFIFWVDDGDNVLEVDEEEKILTQGPASDVLNDATWTLADMDENHVGGASGEGILTTDQTPVYIGKAWCFGTLTPDPVAQGTNSPTDDPGINCDGSSVGQDSQADKLMGDISFRAVQKRNNLDFQCGPLP